MTGRATASGWVTADDGVTLAGAVLDGVYVGPESTPETIDLDLPVDLRSPDWSARSVHRLGYRDLSPEARAAFLVWHGHGRRAPRAPAEWALLHLYGLERRILVDGDDDPALVEEVTELGRVYGNDPRVRGVTHGLGRRPRSMDPPPLEAGPVPDELQVELGRRALASEPVTADWALAWAWYHPDIPRGDAAEKAPAEFAALWKHRFTERCPDGFVPLPKRRRFTVEYEPANPTLPRPSDLTIPDASDVFLTPAPHALLSEITAVVASELAGYARWIGRNPQGADDPAAAGFLPAPLLDGSPAARAARPLVDLARAALDGTTAAVVDAAELDRLWQDRAGRPADSRSEIVAIARILEQHEIGVEPDARFGARSLGERAVLFRLPGPAQSSPTSAYATALVTLQLGAAVAASDGAITPDEQRLLDAQVDAIDGLTDGDRARLGAHRLLLAETGSDTEALTMRLGGVDEGERRRLADHLVDVAWLDGVVTEGERRAVRAMFELLKLDPVEADARLRPTTDAGPTDTGPTDTDPPAATTSVPVPTGDLDDERLRATHEENAAVQDLLGAIFADDVEEADDAVEDAPDDGATIVGLDSRHSALLSVLAARGRSSRADLEADSRRHRVLPDGAVDVINEAALDVTDEPVIDVDEDESVTVDTAIYEEMCA